MTTRMGCLTARFSGTVTEVASAIAAGHSASVAVSRGYAKGWCRTSDMNPHRDWIDSSRDRISFPEMIVPVPGNRSDFPGAACRCRLGPWSTPAPRHLTPTRASRPISPVIRSDAQVSKAVAPHHQHPIGAWLAPADNITSGPMTGHPTSESRTTAPSAQAANAGQGMPSSFIWSFSLAW